MKAKNSWRRFQLSAYELRPGVSAVALIVHGLSCDNPIIFAARELYTNNHSPAAAIRVVTARWRALRRKRSSLKKMERVCFGYT